MKKIITFFKKTTEQLRAAFAMLRRRYRHVFLVKDYYNGWFEGHFIVEGYKRPR